MLVVDARGGRPTIQVTSTLRLRQRSRLTPIVMMCAERKGAEDDSNNGPSCFMISDSVPRPVPTLHTPNYRHDFLLEPDGSDLYSFWYLSFLL
jgi:hypothetical protein